MTSGRSTADNNRPAASNVDYGGSNYHANAIYSLPGIQFHEPCKVDPSDEYERMAIKTPQILIIYIIRLYSAAVRLPIWGGYMSLF